MTAREKWLRGLSLTPRLTVKRAATNPTPDVSSKYGAPMGRYVHPGHIDIEARLHLHQLPLDSGGYDRGGAYWGLPSDLYAWGDGESWAYIRARSRADAKAKLQAEYGDLRFLK